VESTYPEDSERRHALVAAAEMAVSFIPTVGSALQVALTEKAGQKLDDRRARWFNGLATKLFELEDRLGDFDHLVDNDTFMDAVTTATQIADRTSRTEKIEILRNAVVNSVLPAAPDDDTQQVFFELIARFTPTHVRLLKMLSDPGGWFAHLGIPRPEYMSAAKTALIEAAMPEFAGREDLLGRYTGALSSGGLVTGSVSGMMTNAGLWASATSALGLEFLAFIEEPQPAG
jgi:hypothetical protein